MVTAADARVEPMGPLTAARIPPADLLDLLGRDFVRQSGVVPLARTAGILTVATSAPFNVRLLRDVERRTGLAVRVVAATATQTRFLTEAAAPGVDSRAVLWEHALHWLLQRRQAPADRIAPLREAGLLGWPLVREAVAQGVVQRVDVVEAAGLLAGLPTVDLARHTVMPQVARRYTPPSGDPLLPLFRVDGWIVMAMDTLPIPVLLERVERALGLRVLPVLAWPEAVAAAGTAIRGAIEARDREQERERHRERNAPTSEAARMAALIARNRGEDVETVLDRLGADATAAVRRERAQRAGLDRIRLGGLEIPRSVRTAIPRPVAAALQALAIGERATSIEVAVVDPLDEAALQVIQELTSLAVTQVLVSESDLQEALRHLPEATAGAGRPPVLDTLAAGGYAPLEALHAALVDGRVNVGLLAERHHLDATALAEAVGLAYGVPVASPLRLQPDRRVLSSLPEELATAFDAVALQRDEGVSIIALTDPEPRRVAELSAALGVVVFPAAAPAAEAALAATARRVAREEVPTAVAQFTDWLIDRSRITPTQRLRAWQIAIDERVEADIAVLAVTALEEGQVAGEMAELSRTPLVSLDLREETQPVVDAVGMQTFRIRTVDPVQETVATRVTQVQAERWGALPFAEGNGRVQVAFADPRDASLITTVRAALSQDIEVFTAPRRQIRAAIQRVNGQLALGEGLRLAGLISERELQEAMQLHRRSGVRLGRALREMRYISGEDLAAFLAEQHGIPYFDIGGMDVPEEVGRLVPEPVARRHGLLPLFVADGRITVAMADPLDTAGLAAVEAATGLTPEPVLASEDAIESALERIYRAEYLQRSATELLARSPQDSASTVFTRPQIASFAALALLFLLGLAVDWLITVQVALGVTVAFYAAFSSYKFFLIYRALGHEFEVPTPAEEVAALDEASLPVYTILVPMYREPEVLPLLVSGIAGMDYPKTKLDVKLLLEEDDPETINSARSMSLPAHMQVIVVPHGQPKGKPKACNFGLLHARGEYVVIYDAEDIPEADQLKKAIVAFRSLPDEYICLQSKLNYFNRNQNLLTRWFTTEYSMWFDLLLPGLDGTNAPIPLGGTSNHFRTACLREAGGWDPFNVTEDADLGLRIHKRGWKTAVIDSTTYEEANSAVGNWIRQRSRWVKGYMQTWLVHMRNPVKLWRELGPYGFISFQLIIAGTFIGFLLNPLFWAITAGWLVTRWDVINQVFPTPIFFLGSIGLYFGNFAFAYVSVAGALRRQYYGLVKWGLLSPLYWALMSIAAWKALYQLIFNPFYWEKTQHGLFRGEITTAAGRIRR